MFIPSSSSPINTMYVNIICLRALFSISFIIKGIYCFCTHNLLIRPFYWTFLCNVKGVQEKCCFFWQLYFLIKNSKNYFGFPWHPLYLIVIISYGHYVVFCHVKTINHKNADHTVFLYCAICTNIYIFSSMSLVQ